MSIRAGFVFLALLVASPLLAGPRDVFEPPAGSSAPIGLKHPVVLVHGIFARDPGKGAYFRGVAERYAKLGVQVSAPALGFSNGVADRAKRLAAHLDQHWPSGRVNIIAHSIGGLAARDLITRLGYADRVASLTTISTPHRGTVVADWVVRNIGQSLHVEELVDAMGVSSDALKDLQTRNCAIFNLITPDSQKVAYFSLGGAEPWWRIKAPLQPFALLIRLTERVRAGLPIDEAERRWVLRQTGGAAVLAEVDRIAAEVVPDDLRRFYVADWAHTRGANDGVVPLTSAPWGKSFLEVGMDHLDQIGWGSGGTASADFYEALARQLAREGL